MGGGEELAPCRGGSLHPAPCRAARRKNRHPWPTAVVFHQNRRCLAVGPFRFNWPHRSPAMERSCPSTLRRPTRVSQSAGPELIKSMVLPLSTGTRTPATSAPSLVIRRRESSTKFQIYLASIYINKPIELEKIPGIEDMANIMKKHENGEKLTRDERKRFSELKQALRNQSDKIMKQIAANQPNVKKGEYANK